LKKHIKGVGLRSALKKVLKYEELYGSKNKKEE